MVTYTLAGEVGISGDFFKSAPDFNFSMSGIDTVILSEKFIATATELYTLLSPKLHNSTTPSLEFFGKNRIDHNSAIS